MLMEHLTTAQNFFSNCLQYLPLQMKLVLVAYCLLPNKQKTTYSNLFRLLKQKCQESGKNFQPRYIVMDFEIAIHRSARENFPEVTIIGCRFHITQSWWRKIQRVSVDYKNKDSALG